MKRLLFASLVAAVQLSAFSTTNLQYLYGKFEGPTFLDTQNGYKHTVTVEHYRTWEYGDLFAFADYVYAPNGLRFSGDKYDLYGAISPRVSLNKHAALP